MTDVTGTTTYSYDRMGRLTQAAQPNGTLAYAYDRDSNRTTLTYPGSNAVTYTFSSAGRLSSLQDWGSRTTSYTYTAAGLAATATLPNGLVTTYTYDRAQRLTNLTNVVGSTTITSHAYTLDAEGNRTAQTEFVSGITTGASDTFGYTYDGLNRLTAVTTTNAESFTLDSASNIASRTGPSATFSYDSRNRVIQQDDPVGGTTYHQYFTYDDCGNQNSVTDRNGNRTDFTFDTECQGNLLEREEAQLDPYTDRFTTDWEYDSKNNVTQKTDAKGFVSTWTYDGTTNVQLSATAPIDGSTSATTKWIYGDSGNPGLPSRIVAPRGNTTGTPNNTYSAVLAYDSSDTSNRLTGDGGQTFTWSNADRLTGRGSDTFGYDPLDRLTSSTVSATSRTYAYNADGLLQSRTQGGSTTNLLWDPATSPSRLLQVGSDKFVYGLGPLYVVTSGGTTTFARDGGKSVRAELNGSGAVNASFRYRAYGAIAQSNGASTPTYLGYAGQLLDPSGLYYMRARWYEPLIGRFVTRDPVLGIPQRPGTLNPYGYAMANPAIFTDPSGQCIFVCTVIIGAVIGGVVGGASYALQQISTGQQIDARRLAGNVLLGAATGALVGLLFPVAGFAAGAAVGAGTGAASDVISQWANGGDFNAGELLGATLGGAVGGLVSGGTLAPIGKVAVTDAVTIVAANAAGAQLAFAYTLSGWAIGQQQLDQGQASGLSGSPGFNMLVP